MLPVYICDDEKKMQERLQDELSRQIMIGDYDMQITLVTGEPCELLEMIKKKPRRGIYFLDVDLKQEQSERDGFWLGKEIRKYDPRGFIIYITSFGDLAFKTFQYHLEALDYIVKDDILKMIPAIRDCLGTIVNRIQEENHTVSPSSCFTVKMADSVKYIPISEIICFETSSRTHRILLYTETELLDFIGKLSEIEEMLGNDFIRTHRSCLVHKAKIQTIDYKKNEVIMTNGQVCLLSRNMKAKLNSQGL